jgi:hypothetical protein
MLILKLLYRYGYSNQILISRQLEKRSFVILCTLPSFFFVNAK